MAWARSAGRIQSREIPADCIPSRSGGLGSIRFTLQRVWDPGGGFAANAHRHVEGGWLRAMKYIVEELGGDVNARDNLVCIPAHHAAGLQRHDHVLSRLDHGTDVTAVYRRGQTTADMANSPWELLRPFPATVTFLEQLGSANNHACVVC